jgi:hypothetical protein
VPDSETGMMRGKAMQINRKQALRSVASWLGLTMMPSRAVLAAPAKASTPPTLANGLTSLPLLTEWETRSVSPENPTGERGGGAHAAPSADDPQSAPASNLGQGWKVHPFVKPKAGETVTLMDVEGPGFIQHIFMATETDFAGNGRACILRFYWDDETTPSVEVPMTDFFAVGHDIFAPVVSLAVAANPTSGLNCYWPMPFRRRCRITFTNDSWRDLSLLAYQITYAKTALPEPIGYFHAQWRRSTTERTDPVHTLVDGVRGKGRYVGTFVAWTQLSSGWFGEGEVKFYLDGDTEFPSICGTGTEDYFGGSYEFPAVYTGPYSGCTLKQPMRNGPPKWSLYRWHINDPICFRTDFRATLPALGWWPNGKYQPLADDIASVAYWYQEEPHAPFPTLPPLGKRWPR